MLDLIKILLNSFETSINTTVDRSALVLETLSKRDVKCNMTLMTVVWAVVSFNFYLITFLANTFEQVYVTALCLSLADIFGYIINGILGKKIGAKKTLFLSQLTAAIGGFLILVYGLQHQDSCLFPVFFFVSKLGTTCCFGTVFTGNTEIFPEEITASAMGIC